MSRQLGFALVTTLAVSLLPGCAGQRRIQVQVEREGVLTLQSEFGVSDSLDAKAMWASMQGESFAAVSPIKPEPEDPEKAVLKGKLRMVILHVDKEIAAAKISELRIVRAPGDRWKLAPGEIERTSHAAGL